MELMVAVRPTFPQSGFAGQTSREHRPHRQRTPHSQRRLQLGADEAAKYGVHFDTHDDRYARTSEWLDVIDGCWQQQHFSYSGRYYSVADNVLAPKPVRQPRPTIYAGGESETAKNLIASKCDAYLMHGDSPEIVGPKIVDMRERRERRGLPPMTYGVAGYAIVRDSEAEARHEVTRITDVQQSARGYQNYQQWVTGSKLEQKISLEDYSVSNRGLRSGLVGTARQVKERVAAFHDVGVDLLLCNQARSARRWSASRLR